MKQALALFAALALVVGLAYGQAAPANPMAAVAAKAKDALAIVQFTVEDEITTQTVAGIAVCITTGGQNGTILMNMALDSRVPIANVKKTVIVSPNTEGKALNGIFLGVDPETGCSFVMVDPNDKDTTKWATIEFAKNSDLSIGKQVVSVGLLDARFGFEPYVGTAYVAAKLRVPHQLIYCSGGQLTGVGSPVFNTDGKAIGIVQQQLYSSWQIMDPRTRQPQDVDVRNRQETQYFVPIEEFGAALQRIPDPAHPRRLAWTGILSFTVVPDDTAKMLDLKGPAVAVGKVVPETPAAKAGLKDGDVVVKLDDQPIEKLATPQLTRENFVRLLARKQAGQKAKFTVLRPGAKGEQTIECDMVDTPTRPDEAKKYPCRLGFVARNKVALDQYVDPSATAMGEGLYVILLVNNGPAAAAGLKADDLIVAVNGKKVASVDDLKEQIDAAQASPSSPVNMVVQRGKDTLQISVKQQPTPAEK